MTTLEMFIDAAKALQKDPIYLNVEELRIANDNDAELVKKIDDFNTSRGELTSMMSDGEPDRERMAELNNSVRALYTEIMETEGMVKYSEAKEGLDKLVAHIQAVLGAALAGEDPETAEPSMESCGGSCSSCSGCS